MNWKDELDKPVGYLSDGKMITLKELMKLKSDWKAIGSGEPSDPIIGDKAMKGRRWKIDWDANGKAYDKITKPTAPSKVLPYNKFYEIIQEVLSSTNASDVLNVDSKGCGASEFMKFFQIADEPERKTVEELLDTGDSNKILKAFQIVIDVLRAAGQLNLYKLEENTMKYKDFYKELNETITENWKGKLQDQYESFEEFERYSETYGLAKRLGFNSAQDAWDTNPVITGGVNPGDYKRIKETTGCSCGCTADDKCNESSQCACDCGVVEESGKKKTTKKVVNPTNKGTFDNKTVEDLNKMKAVLHKKNDANEEQGKPVPHANKVAMSQINFALRAKKNKLVKEEGNENIVSIFDLVKDWENEGYGIALVDNATDKVVEPYVDPSDYPNLKFTKSCDGAMSIDGKYYIRFHSGKLEVDRNALNKYGEPIQIPIKEEDVKQGNQCQRCKGKGHHDLTMKDLSGKNSHGMGNTQIVPCDNCDNGIVDPDRYDRSMGTGKFRLKEDGLTVNKMDHTIDTDHTKNCDGARRNGSRISIG